MVKIILPELGEGITKATISFWYFKINDPVNANEDLVELTTDKTTFNLPSPATGKLAQILFKEGQDVKVGETLGILE